MRKKLKIKNIFFFYKKFKMEKEIKNKTKKK